MLILFCYHSLVYSTVIFPVIVIRVVSVNRGSVLSVGQWPLAGLDGSWNETGVFHLWAEIGVYHINVAHNALKQSQLSLPITFHMS